MSGEAFATYTTYTTHVDNLCYYLESRMFNDATSLVIRRLLLGANDTARALAEVVNASEDLRVAQEAALNRSLSVVRAFEASQQVALASQERMGAAISESWGRYEKVSAVLRQLAEYAAVLLHLQGYIVG
jgi:hypothetical protein